MKLKNLMILIASVLLMGACAEELQQEVVSHYADGQPQKINYFKWQGNTKVVVKELRLFPNGEKEIEGEFKDGQKHGTWTYWNAENGKKWSEEAFKNGIKEGKTTVWYISGQKEYEGYYKDGKPDGQWTYWDADGKKNKVSEYENGQKVSEEVP